MSETSNKVLNKLKIWAKEVFSFLSSTIFLKNLAGILIFVTLLILLMSWWLKCYTNHNESLQVHKYIGMQLEDAQKMAEDKSFRIIITDSVYKAGIAPFTVLDQTPKPLTRVKEKRNIYLTVRSFSGKMKKLPIISDIGDEYKTYASALKRLGINAKVKEEIFDSKLTANTILDIEYNGESILEEINARKIKIAEGDTLYYKISKRGGESVPIPNLICKKYDEAAFIISNNYLNIGSIIKDNTVDNASSAYIWRQVPAYDPYSQVRMGEQINLYLTKYKPDNCAALSQQGDLEEKKRAGEDPLVPENSELDQEEDTPEGFDGDIEEGDG